MSQEPPEETADRPLQCVECKKAIAVLYTVVEQGSVAHTVMCEQCPQLERRLRGTKTLEIQDGTATSTGVTGLVCAECQTSLAEVRSGMRLGCSECYEVFADALLNEMVLADRVPKHVAQQTADNPIHVGRSPGQVEELRPTIQLQALKDALNETLHREDYEQAAWLRDQIKKLTGENDE